MIEFHNITYTYDKNVFIENINLTFLQGKITALIGPNGCGKSTLLKIGARLLAPQKGRVLFNGIDIKNMRPKEYACKVSLLSQSNYPPGVTAKDYVMSGRYPHMPFGRNFSSKDRNIAQQAMELTGCTALENKSVNQLSGGERQKVFIAMAIAQDTDVIFLDEPTTYLDICVSYEIMELVQKLNRDMGKTIIMVLHDLNLALNYADKVVLMNQGRIIANDTAKVIAECGELARVFQVSVKSFSGSNNTYYFFDKEQQDIRCMNREQDII